MRLMVQVVMFCAVLGVTIGQADAQVEVKVAGGALFDPTSWGGHFSIEIPIGDTYPTYLAPFVEWYRISAVGQIPASDEIPAGVGLIYKAPFSDQYGTVFFGVGGGLLYTRGVPTRDDFGRVLINATTGQLATGSLKEPLLSVAGGLRLDVVERVGVLVQGRWFRAFASGATNNFSVQAGLSLALGER